MNYRDKVREEGGKFNIYWGDTKKDGKTHLEDTGYMDGGMRGNFVMTPRLGPLQLGITSGVQRPGQGMNPHVHPTSSETLLCFKGKGQFYLKDRWIDVEEGDIVYAPPGVMHGSRNPAENTEYFVCVGIGSPPQLDLYTRAGYDPNGDDDEYEIQYHV